MPFLVAVKPLAAEEVGKQVEWFVGCNILLNSQIRQGQEEAEEEFLSLLVAEVAGEHSQLVCLTIILVVSLG